MQLVLDSNEYIFALGLSRKKSCETLLKHLINNISSHSICTCRTIIEEVRVNLTIKDFHNFVKFVNIFTNIDEDFFIPFELGKV